MIAEDPLARKHDKPESFDDLTLTYTRGHGCFPLGGGFAIARVAKTPHVAEATNT